MQRFCVILHLVIDNLLFHQKQHYELDVNSWAYYSHHNGDTSVFAGFDCVVSVST